VRITRPAGVTRRPLMSVAASPEIAGTPSRAGASASLTRTACGACRHDQTAAEAAATTSSPGTRSLDVIGFMTPRG